MKSDMKFGILTDYSISPDSERFRPAQHKISLHHVMVLSRGRFTILEAVGGARFRYSLG